MRDKEQINEQVNLAAETRDRSLWPAMSYEDGVIAALDWVTGYTDDLPMEE